ncbi:MAG: choice-of-anchor Q domain-containing protein [Trueperaceae bacterium]
MVNGPVKGRGFGRLPKRFLSYLLLAAALLLAACSPAPATPTGSIQVTVTGLANGANIQVSGPSGYSRAVTATTTLENLTLGDYTLEAASSGEYFVVGERSQDVTVTADAEASVSFAYARAFEFTAAADATLLSLDGTTELTATLASLHPDLSDVDVTLTAPAGWDLSLTGPWAGAAAGSISTFATDTAADFGPNEFVFTVTGSLHGQALEHEVVLGVDLLPVVTNTGDNVATPLQGSLRYLVAHPRVEGRTITFDPEAAGGTQLYIELQDELVIEQSLSIEGLAEPADWVTLTPASGVVTRLVYILPNPGGDAFDVTMSRLAFVNGTAPASAEGGAIRSHGNLTVTDSLFSENGAHHGGAIYVAAGSLTATNVVFELNGADERGGAVYANNQTRIELRDSIFSENEATNGGAVMAGFATATLPADRTQVLIVDSTFEENRATNAGAFSNYGDATVQGSHFERNTATSGGGAIRNHYKMTLGTTQVVENEAAQYGGILSDGIMEIEGSLISGNTALIGDGGGVYSGWAGGNYRVDDTDLKSLVIVNSRIVGNRAVGNGGGIYSVQILAISDSTVANNVAEGAAGGGGVFAFAPAQGAVPPQDEDNQRGETIITGTTFSGNEARTGNGGAIVVDVAVGALEPRFRMTNSTVAYNSAELDGGGLWLASQGAGITAVGVNSWLLFSTIVGNESTTGYGGGVGTRYGDLALWGTILANNVMLNPGASPSVIDLYMYSGSADSDGYNWITADPAGAFNVDPSDVVGQPTVLAALADNGGPTQTMLPADPQLGSVPLDSCRDRTGALLSTDQRGYPRPGSNGMCFRGSVEPG